MNQTMTTEPLVTALRKSGFKLTQSRLLNVRTGERWVHRRVICSTSKVDHHKKQIFATAC